MNRNSCVWICIFFNWTKRQWFFPLWVVTLFRCLRNLILVIRRRRGRLQKDVVFLFFFLRSWWHCSKLHFPSLKVGDIVRDMLSWCWFLRGLLNWRQVAGDFPQASFCSWCEHYSPESGRPEPGVTHLQACCLLLYGTWLSEIKCRSRMAYRISTPPPFKSCCRNYN